MQPHIHPNYFNTTISCACGSKHETRSTKQYNTDICAMCHPYFTGKSKLIDAEGRIDRFKKKYQNFFSESAQ